jgi:L-iditol 2-dehydrogenase
VKSRTAYQKDVRNIEVIERDIEVGDTDVVIRVHQASMNNTDLLHYQGRLPYDSEPLGVLPYRGQEGGGVVEAIGSKVTGWKPGDKVFCYSQGMLSDFVACKPAQLVKMPEGADMDVICIAGGLTVPMFAVHRAGIVLGDTVAVFGAGFNGQVIAQGAKQSGAERVIVVDAFDGRLAIAKNCGADVVINSDKEDAQAAILDLTGGLGVDVAIEATGYGHKDFELYMNVATQVTRHNGILGTVGWPTVPISVHMHRWHHHGLDVRVLAERHHSQGEALAWIPFLIRPYMQGRIDVKSLVTSRFKLADAAAAFDVLDKDPNQIKVTVTP